MERKDRLVLAKGNEHANQAKGNNYCVIYLELTFGKQRNAYYEFDF